MCILRTIFIKLIGTKCKDSHRVHTSMERVYNILLDVDRCIVIGFMRSFNRLERTNFSFLAGKIFFACKNRGYPRLNRTVNREIDYSG